MEIKFSVSRYQKTNSIFNNFDSRVKLFCYFIIIACIFFPLGIFGPTLMFGIISIIVILSRVNLKIFWKTLKPTLFFSIFIFLINVLSTQPQWYGAWIASIYSIKLWSILLLASLLTITTTIDELTFSISSFFKPLRYIKFPYEEFSLMISLGIRFIPNIFTDAIDILTSQQARGLEPRGWSIKRKWESLKLLFQPLLVHSFKRADELSNALLAKGYVIGKKRSSYIEHKYKSIDLIPLFFSLSILAIYILFIVNPNGIFSFYNFFLF